MTPPASIVSSRTLLTGIAGLLIALTPHAEAKDEKAAITGSTPAGTTLSVSLSERKKPLLLVFWASWCGRCNLEAPAIERLRKDAIDTLEVISVSVDKTPEDAKTFITKQSITSSVLMDSELTISDRFSVRGTPALLLFSSDGALIARDNSLSKPFLAALKKSL